jgi:[ribosomal protein S5]-alanine N-acetyltransferase
MGVSLFLTGNYRFKKMMPCASFDFCLFLSAMENRYLLEGQESARLTYRRLLESDFDTWMEFTRHPLSDRYWSALPDAPEVKCRAWFNKVFERYTHNQGGMNVLIEKNTGHFVGQCGLLVQRVDDLVELEVGYSIMPAFWNQGFATEAAAACIAHAFANKLSNSVISIIHEDNVESEKVALKNNLILEKRTLYKNNPVKIYRIAHPGFR